MVNFYCDFSFYNHLIFYLQSTGELEKVRKMLKLKTDINEEDNDGNNALALAIRNGSFSFILAFNEYFERNSNGIFV